MTHMIVAYDIAGDRRRLRVVKVPEDFGNRVQFGGFECKLENEETLDMIGRLEDEFKCSEDASACIGLVSPAPGPSTIIGQGKELDLPDAYVV